MCLVTPLILTNTSNCLPNGITTSHRVIRLVLPGWEESGAYYPTIKRTTSDPAHVYVQRSNLFNLLEVQLGYCLVQASAVQQAAALLG